MPDHALLLSDRRPAGVGGLPPPAALQVLPADAGVDSEGSTAPVRIGSNRPVPPAASGAGASVATREPRLEIPPCDLGAATALQRELDIGRVLAQVLVRRGFADPRRARDFLSPTEVHDPSGFAGIDRAVQTIGAHIRAGHRIVVHGDYDVDGVCATAIMVRALRSLGAEVSSFLPSRLLDGYGLSAATVERLGQRETQLLITVDCGITAVDEVAAARAGGMDVIVSDHHSPRADGRLPDCAIVHPGICGYPCPELCGTGVAYKLVQALGAPALELELELVALATVADLMPLQGENRRLVREGIAAMANTTRPGLRALMAVSRTDPSDVDASALGFRLAPRINAAGRLARPDAGLELLLTEDSERAGEIAQELDDVNAERRAVEQRILWQAEAQVTSLGERSAYVLADRDWHPGVIGIVASRIVERHHRPTVMIALGSDGPGQGSGRSISGFDLLGALHAASEHLIAYGGHRAAAGLTVDPERIEALRAAVESHADQVLTPELLTPVERVDAVVCGSELGLGLAEELTRLEPCGMGNPRTRLLVPGARFADVRTMGEGRHVRFAVSSGGARARAVAFGCDGKVPGGESRPLDATFSLERNVWKGAIEPRLVLRHARGCGPPAIEVIGENKPYLEIALAELEHRQPVLPTPGPARRSVADWRGRSPLAALADAGAAGGQVLAVCADVARRLPGLAARTGGFALIAYPTLSVEPSLSLRFSQLVALDPPSDRGGRELLRVGAGYAYLAWGEAELRFAEQMHATEYDLRNALVALYRRLKIRREVVGDELEGLLRGEERHSRSPRLAGRLIRVLSELGLITVDLARPAVAIASESSTRLERSPAYRAYAQLYEDGRRYLSNPDLLPGA